MQPKWYAFYLGYNPRTQLRPSYRSLLDLIKDFVKMLESHLAVIITTRPNSGIIRYKFSLNPFVAYVQAYNRDYAYDTLKFALGVLSTAKSPREGKSNFEISIDEWRALSDLEVKTLGIDDAFEVSVPGEHRGLARVSESDLVDFLFYGRNIQNSKFVVNIISEYEIKYIEKFMTVVLNKSLDCAIYRPVLQDSGFYFEGGSLIENLSKNFSVHRICGIISSESKHVLGFKPRRGSNVFGVSDIYFIEPPEALGYLYQPDEIGDLIDEDKISSILDRIYSFLLENAKSWSSPIPEISEEFVVPSGARRLRKRSWENELIFKLASSQQNDEGNVDIDNQQVENVDTQPKPDEKEIIINRYLKYGFEVSKNGSLVGFVVTDNHQRYAIPNLSLGNIFDILRIGNVYDFIYKVRDFIDQKFPQPKFQNIVNPNPVDHKLHTATTGGMIVFYDRIYDINIDAVARRAE